MKGLVRSGNIAQPPNQSLLSRTIENYRVRIRFHLGTRTACKNHFSFVHQSPLLKTLEIISNNLYNKSKISKRRHWNTQEFYCVPLAKKGFFRYIFEHDIFSQAGIYQDICALCNLASCHPINLDKAPHELLKKGPFCVVGLYVSALLLFNIVLLY